MSAVEGKQTPGKRVDIIRTVHTPLGFFTLVVLVVEVVLGSVAALSAGGDRTLLILGMLALIFLLVILVACLAVFRPEALGGTRPGSQAAEASERKTYARSVGGVTSLWNTEIQDDEIREQLQDLAEKADREPSNSQPCTEAGLVYRDRVGDYGLAVWWFIESILRTPAESYPYDRIAEIFERLEDYRQAIQWYSRSAKADPNNCWPCDRIGILYKDRLGDCDAAITWFNESIRRKPRGSSIPYDRIAEIHRDQHEDPDGAIEWFTKSAEADPGNHFPSDELGLLYRDAKQDAERAVEWFQESIRRKPGRSYPYDRIAEIYRDDYRDIPEAIRWFEKSVEAEPNNPYPKEQLKELRGQAQ